MSVGSKSRSTRKHFSPRIGVIITPTDAYWIEVLNSIIHTNQKLGANLVFLQPAATLEAQFLTPPKELVELVLAHELDVLIMTLVSLPVIEALVAEKLPVISLAEMDYQLPLFSVISSLYPGGRMAGQYIGRKLGGRGYAVCITAGMERISNTGQNRLAGFYDGLRPYPGILTDHIEAYWGYSQAYSALLKIFENYPRPIDAIFGVSDSIILAARDAGSKLGIIDDHTVLVGLNGDAPALVAVAEGSLSATVNTGAELTGSRAMELAYQTALGAPLPAVVDQSFQLITKDNVGSLATRKLISIGDIPNQMVGYNRQQELDRMSQLETSMEISRQIGSLMERNQLFQVISELVQQHYGYNWMRILRWSEKKQALEEYGGNLSPVSKKISIEQDQLLHQAFHSNETIFIPDLHTSHHWHLGAVWEPIRARALLPLLLGERVIGVVDLQSNLPIRQTSLEMIGLKLLASQLSIAIQNSDLYLEALQARNIAEQANQLKTRLVTNVGHEMRSPLNAILGFSQAIQKKVEDNQPLDRTGLYRDIQLVYKSGEHLMYMINDLLDLSRAEIGALSLYFEPMQPAPLLKDVFEKFTLSGSVSPEVQWKLDLPESLPIIRADVVRLRQILINLLANASKYTSHGAITLGAAVELPYLHLWVSDTGKGVPVDLQEKIFEPFSTTGRKRRPEGVGLGLSITRHLVSLHQGLITLESRLGQGSTFHVYLPLPGTTQESIVSPQEGNQPIMLVVTNLAQIPAEIAKISQRHGYRAYLIHYLADMNNALSEGVPAAIAWDLAHASLGEWNLLARLSATRNCSALPLILFGAQEKADSLDRGLTNVLFKPCNGNTLNDWINQIDVIKGGDDSILVVDDDLQAAEYYRDLLSHSFPQNRLMIAHNGRQALDILQTETPAIILLDLVMPDMDGFSVLEKVRSEVRTQNVPVVVISGKLLNYEDIQRLNYFKTVFYTKGILTKTETIDYLSQIEGETRPLPQPTSQLVKQGLAFMHQNYAQPISRKEIACAVGVSENYLSTIFRQEISISPWDYLNRFRIQKAKERLVQSQDSVTQIAIQVGFNDSAYFSRVFHKMTGQSPVKYRQFKR